MHQIKSLVDVPEAQVMSYVLINLNLLHIDQNILTSWQTEKAVWSLFVLFWRNYLLHVLLNEPWYLRSALETTKSCSLPNTASHELEWTSRNLLTRGCNTHNNGCSPPLQIFFPKQTSKTVKRIPWWRRYKIRCKLTLWQHSKAALITETFPMHSKL